MKKTACFLLTIVLFVLLASSVFAATQWTENAKYISGGENRTAAVCIPKTEYSKVLSLSSYIISNEYYLVAPNDGTYIFTITADKGGCSILLYDEKGNYVGKSNAFPEQKTNPAKAFQKNK